MNCRDALGRVLLACVLLGLPSLALGLDPGAISLPVAVIVGPAESRPGDLVVLRATGSVGKSFVWRVIPVSAAERFFSFTERDSSGKVISSVGIFASRTPGTYTFVLVAVAGDHADIALHETKNGEGPDPDPDPDPPDPDPPPPGPRFVLVVHESADRTGPLTVALVELRAYLASKGHLFKFVDKDLLDSETGQPAPWLQPYFQHITQAGVELPALIVLAKSSQAKPKYDHIYVEHMPEDGTAAIAIVKKYEGRKR